MRFLFPISILLWVFPNPLPAQPGCTDPQASNYDPNASGNDGSCVYPATNYSLAVKTSLSTALKESSGLVWAGGSLWTHNDTGDGPYLYKIDTLTNAILQTVTIGGATNVDWEDIAFDGTNFYAGDFGNNANGNRTDLKIYKFPLSTIPAGDVVTVPADQVQVINFSYDDQTNFTPQGSNNTSFDCEAMLYRNGELHLFTKDWVNLHTSHYTLPTAAGTYTAVKRESFFANGLVTGADITPQGVLVLLGYAAAGGPNFLWLLFDYPPGVFFGGNKRRIDLGSWLLAGQTEGICFRNSASGYVSNEQVSVIVPARLYGFDLSQWLQPVFLPAVTPPATDHTPCGVVPNPLPAGRPLSLQPLPLENTQLIIWDIWGRLVWQGGYDPSEQPAFSAGWYALQVRSPEGAVQCAASFFVW